MRGLSLVVASGGHSSSRCAGLSLSWPLLLRSTGSRRAGSVVVAHGPSCSAACGIFPDQGSNLCPLHWQADSQPLRHQGSPRNMFSHLWNQGVFYKHCQPGVSNDHCYCHCLNICKPGYCYRFHFQADSLKTMWRMVITASCCLKTFHQYLWKVQKVPTSKHTKLVSVALKKTWTRVEHCFKKYSIIKILESKRIILFWKPWMLTTLSQKFSEYKEVLEIP